MKATKLHKQLLEEADKKDLLASFIKKMLELTYCPEIIGEELAIIIWAIDNPLSP